jgi:hypothetical protein
MARTAERADDVKAFVHAATKGGSNVCGPAEAEAAEFPRSQAERTPRGVIAKPG